MNRFLTISLGLLVLMGSAVFSTASAEPDVMGAMGVSGDGTLVKALTDLGQELLDDTQPEYLFPLEAMPGIDAATLKLSPASPIDVAHGQSHKHALRSAFQLSLDATGPRPVLKLRVDFKLITQPGMYEVLVGISGAAPPSAGRASPTAQQYLTLKLTHPEAQLRATSGTWVVDRNDAWFWTSSPSLNPAQLKLTETTGRTRVDVKRFAAIQEAAQDDQQLNAGIEPKLPLSVPAGTTVATPITLRGEFPPGVSKGSFQIEGDQLKTPLLVSYEVRRKLYWGFVPLIFFLSGLFGWLVRTYLKHWRERAALQAQANDLLLRIEEQLRAGLDETMQMALRDAAREIEKKYNSPEPAELTAAIQAADDALNRSNAERVRLRKELLISVTQGLSALQKRQTLPAELHKLCESMDDVLEAVQREIVADNLRAARTKQVEADKALRQFCEKMIVWGERVQGSLATLDSWPQAPGLAVPQDQRDKVKASIEPIVGFSLDQPLTIESALKPLHEALRAVGALARQLQDQLLAAAESCTKQLQLAERPDCRAQSTALMDAVAVDVTDLSQPFTALHAAWGNLKSAIMNALRTTYPQAVASAQQELEAMIAQGKIEDAIDQAKSCETPALTTGRGKLMTASATGNPFRVSSAASTGSETVVVALGERASRLVVLDSSPAPLRIRHAQSLAELRRATWVRSVCYVVLSTAAATFLYGPKFFGTWGEIFGLIAFGFSSDFTVGTVLEETLNKLKK